MLSWPEVREMHRSGIDFGAHTLTHPDLTRLPRGRAETEICESRRVLEAKLGAPVRAFSYPYGRCDSRVRLIVEQHFDCACSDRLGLITAQSDPCALERVDAYYLRTDGLFDLMLTGAFPWYIWARSIPRRLRRVLRRDPWGR